MLETLCLPVLRLRRRNLGVRSDPQIDEDAAQASCLVMKLPTA